MICYYAHCKALYNTVQEERDLGILSVLFAGIINPNSPKFEEQCRASQERGETGAYRLKTIFRPAIEQVDVLVFRALPDGSIPSGVAFEIEVAEQHHIPVIELPSAIRRRRLSYEETIAYLREVGQR